MARERSSRVPLADSVYQTLFDQFLDGTRAAGEPLNIAVLSDELEVSQTPIREALARLEHTGLVRREPLKGYRVAPLLTEAELIQLMDARVLLEPALTTEAGKRVTPDFLQELLDTIVALDKASQSPSIARSFPKYWSADERFHVLIAQQSGNTFLATAYAALGGHLQRFRLFAELGAWDAQYAAAEHRGIYDALAGGDPDLAAVRMRQHVLNSRTRTLKDRRTVDTPHS